MSETYEEMLKRHEGLRLSPYIDSVGVQTIGYGHNLQRPFSIKAMEQQFLDDVASVHNECLHAFPWYADLSEPRQWAVKNMCFNLGLSRLLRFKEFLKAMEFGDYETAANEMLDSVWAKQVKGRALELAQLIRGAEQV